MNDLSIIVERYGRVGAVERMLPEFVTPKDKDGNKRCCWSSAVGMVKINRIEDLESRDELPNELLASIVVTQKAKSEIDMMEFHGVTFFKPLEGLRWEEQIDALRRKPSMFELMPLTRLESGGEYVFFAARASKNKRKERRTLCEVSK